MEGFNDNVDSSFYEDEPPDSIGPARAFLESYSHIPPDEVDAHLHAIRDRLWKVAKYRCIGRWRFVSTDGLASPGYTEALARLTAPGSRDELLDLACCVGQAVRRLAADGADSARLLGADLHAEFIDIGYDLFRDRDTLRATFAAGDLFDPADPGFASAIAGRPTIVHAQAFFHLFDWDHQVRAAERIVRLLRPGVTDAMVFGRQMGGPDAEELPNIRGGTRFAHNPASFQRMWDEVGAATGTKWVVDATLEPRPADRRSDGEWTDRKRRMSFRFVVRQVA